MINKQKRLKEFCLALFIIVSTYAFGQPSKIIIEQLSEHSEVSWSLLDSSKTVISNSGEMRKRILIDTIPAHQRYYFQLSVQSVAASDTALFRISLDDNIIMLILTNQSSGIYTYPFFSGKKIPALRIIGGSDADIANFPWQVFFSTGDYVCGGSIISSKYILTAAHCTQDDEGRSISYADMKIKVGSTENPYYNFNGTWYDVKSYTIHENYDNNTYINDIALLELEEEINFEEAEIINLISAEDIANGATDPGVFATVTGYGLSGVNPQEVPSNLQVVELPIVSNGTAARIWGTIPDNMLMAGYINGGRDACSGDSGGPLTVSVDGTSKKKLAGIVSWGSTNCDTYGGYTRVSSYLDWIHKYVKPKLSNPTGENVVCTNVDSSTYYTSSSNAKNIEWNIEPSNAADILTNNTECTLIWDSSFAGLALLKVKGIIEDIETDWSTISISREEKAIIRSKTNDTAICNGDTLNLSIAAEGSNIVYSWYKNNTLLTSSYQKTLQLLNSTPNESGVYRCILSGSCGAAVEDSIKLIVYPTTNISVFPDNAEINMGSDTSIVIEANGNELSYHWYQDGNLLSEQGSPVLKLTEVNATQIGNYHVLVNGTCGSDSSNIFYIYVQEEISDEIQSIVWPTISSGNSINIALSNNNTYSVTVLNTRGEYVLNKNNLTFNTELNLSYLAQGFYFLVIESDKYKTVKRIIIQ